jgi:biotin/methionine sulfoxide reductase
MELFASHFGTYEIGRGPEGASLLPFRHDPAPSVIGQGFLTLADHPTRITRPHARKGWLAGDRGAARGADSFVPISLDEACALAAGELTRIRDSYGNGAIFGG